MKNIIVILLFFLQTSSINAQNIDKVLDRFYKACGKKEDWKSIKSLKYTVNSVFYIVNDTTVSVGFMSETSPNLYCMEGVKNKKRYKFIHDGQYVWYITQDTLYRRSEFMERAAKEDTKIGDTFLAKRLCDYKHRKFKLMYLEKTQKGNAIYDVILLKEGENETKIFFNKQTGLIDYTELENIISHITTYKKVQGLLIPYEKIEYQNDTPISASKMTTIEINPTISREVFTLDYHIKK